ncbi:MAG TPA: OmpA family protein, partial [Kofleriaceae bacterium]|nr:OmpA family protein [Kofleriaceae bacterium]
PARVKLKVQRTARSSGGDGGRTLRASGPATEEKRPVRASGQRAARTPAPDRAVRRAGGGATAPDAAAAAQPVTAPAVEPAAPAVEPAAPAPARREGSPRLGRRIFFPNASAELSSAARSRLEQSARWLAAHPEREVTIQGHASAVGDPDANRALAERRAQAVRDLLVELGVDAGRITVESFGDERPEFTPASSGRNRRVVIDID